MIRVAEAINSFPPVGQQADIVSPSEEEPVFILTSSQLSALITRAVQKAIDPLVDRVSSMEDRISHLEEENACMRLKMASLESVEEQDISRLALDIAYDRQRLAKLEKVEPQPMQKDRGEILRALIASNGGKMLARDARNKMRLDKATFSRLLATLKDEIDARPLHQDKRRLLLIIK
jgi:uncharacterized membrane protein